jgi:hypothetical protein
MRVASWIQSALFGSVTVNGRRAPVTPLALPRPEGPRHAG